MQVLGIETSCDETAVAVVRDGSTIVSNVVVSQVDLHRVFGGIVPEVASRKHVEMISVVIDRALTEAGADWSDLDVIAATHGPGLVGSLLVGVCAAKGLALARHKPLVGVNHLEGHLYSNFLTPDPPSFPFICLIVSGGHTDLLWVRGHGDYELLGRTRDDAAGESFDKVARALGLEYPGGPAIDRVARSGNPAAFDFPRAWLPDSFDFSFSGLKTAVVRAIQTLDPAARGEWVADVAASFQQAIVDVLVEKAWQAAAARSVRHVAVCGGVAGNSALRAAFLARAAAAGGSVSQPPLSLCTDNAAMIAAAGYFRYLRTGPSGLDLDVSSTLPLDWT
jgi:N6-L-threonylcarbamoyladenine synthase